MRRLPLVLSLLALAACGAEAPPTEPAPGEPAAPQDASTNATGPLPAAEGARRASAPVDVRDLRALVPEAAAGLTRTDMGGATEGAMGLSISRVDAAFADEAGATVALEVVDLGTFPQLTMFGLGWVAAPIDRESGAGYERTTEFEGHPAYEEVQGDRAELQLIVAGRFLVSAEGRAEMGTLQDLVRALDLDALAAMRDANVEA